MLSLVQVSKSYGTTRALQIVDLEVAPGETVVLIGPSGCGKSTLLRLLAGLVTSDSGRIVFDGQNLTEESLPLLRRRMGYVIQEGGLFPHLNIRRNVTLMADYLRHNPVGVEARLAELSELVHLPKDLWSRYPDQLSGGQRQRVSLMRALMLDPDVLLLDEPLGALDPMIRYDLQQDLKQIFIELGKTVVMVTHDIAEAAYFAHRLVLMRDGRIVQIGSLRELTDQPNDEFVPRFINAQREPMKLLTEGLS